MNNKPDHLPEMPEEQPFKFQCPECFSNEYTESANRGLLICKRCKTEVGDGEATQVNETRRLIESDMLTKKPFKDTFED